LAQKYHRGFRLGFGLDGRAAGLAGSLTGDFNRS
jgi:hypothetical protein